MKLAGYRPRKAIWELQPSEAPCLDERTIAKEEAPLVISTNAIAVGNQAIGNRVRLKHSCFLK